MRVAVVGANGRMGCAVVRLAGANGFAIASAVGAGDIGRDAGEVAGIGRIGVSIGAHFEEIEFTRPDVVIDFSAPQSTLALAPIAAAAGIALVSGTTGLDAAGRAALDRAADRVAVLWEPNMSFGIHVLSRIVAQATSALSKWNVEIVESHHAAKVDAPSGTAVRLAEVVQHARPGARLVFGRQGQPGGRGVDEVGMHAIRGGDVIGDHVVHLFGDGERIELTHRATSRDVFAHGALRAARWIVGKPPGRYGLDDVLDLRNAP